MLCCVDWQRVTDFRVLCTEDEGTIIIRNLGDYLQSKRRAIPEDLNLQQHCCQKLRPCVLLVESTVANA